ncbi:MAG TPA: fumarylacetoacetate hydrolase family protein [Burkholderiaceae bacterium]|nr:fumarylacetoacetate hydrolase family protein [Burkholderiaceae bacterium]
MQTLSKIDEVLDTFEAAARSTERLPSTYSGKLGMDDAYRIQLAMLQRRVTQGAQHIGWKVGLTSSAMQQQQGVFEPCFGYLLASGQEPSGRSFAFDSLIAPGFENELCLTIGTTLHGSSVNYESARRAVSHVAPALEIVEKRGTFNRDLPLSIADNAQQKAFVTGTAIELDPAVSLAETSVAIMVDGVEQERASGAEVLGDPIHSIVWLAQKLAQFGLPLERGAKVMSGSFTRQYALQKGHRISACFTPFGSVSATFV